MATGKWLHAVHVNLLRLLWPRSKKPDGVRHSATDIHSWFLNIFFFIFISSSSGFWFKFIIADAFAIHTLSRVDCVLASHIDTNRNVLRITFDLFSSFCSFNSSVQKLAIDNINNDREEYEHGKPDVHVCVWARYSLYCVNCESGISCTQLIYVYSCTSISFFSFSALIWFTKTRAF